MIYDFWKKISAKVKHVQSLPEKEKIRIIWILAILIVALIVIIWMVFFRSYRIPDSSEDNKAIEDLKNNLENQVKDKLGGKLEIPKLEIPKNVSSETPPVLATPAK